MTTTRRVGDPQRGGRALPGHLLRRSHLDNADPSARAHRVQGASSSASPPAPRVPYSSVLYCHMVGIEERIAASWRGLGTDEDTKSLAAITRRLDELENVAGPGMAWTPLDELLARRAAKGTTVVVDAEHFDWLTLCHERAATPMPEGYRCGNR